MIYLAKLTSILTLVIASPLIAIGMAAIAFVHVFDYLGQFSLWPAHKMTDWLQEYQRNTIRAGHAIISIEEIQERTGKADEDL